MSNPLEEAAGAAFDGVDTPEAEATVEETPVESSVEEVPVEETPEVSTEETPTEGDTPEQSEVESFTKIKPDDLTDREKALYKELQADYTRKRQTESKRVKDLEAELAKLAKAAKEVKPTEATSEEPTELDPRTIARQEARAVQEESWEKQALKDIESIEPRLNENHPDHDKVYDRYARDELDTRLGEYVAEMGTKVGFDYKATLKDISKDWNGYVADINKSYLERQKALAKEKEATLKKQSPKTSKAKGKDTASPTIDDAVGKAFESI